MSGENVLLIAPDDSPGRQAVRLAGPRRFTVVGCPDAGQALTRLHRIGRRPLAIVAVLPPFSAGIEAFRAIQRNLPGFHDLPFVVVLDSVKDEPRSRLLEASLTLIRPFDEDALVDGVRRLSFSAA